MNVAIITLFPEMFCALESGVIGRAQKNKHLKLSFLNPRDFTHDKHLTVDDKPYGGGPGMLMSCEPLYQAICAAKNLLGYNTPVIYLSPQGRLFSHEQAKHTAAKCPNLILLCGRYEGIDERIITHYVDEEWSTGDYVLSGGELPAMCIIDALTRLLPGVLGDDNSALLDSFSNSLFDHPHYTRPDTFQGHKVPDVLTSGNHQAIKQFRSKESLRKTWQTRPDLVKRAILTHEQEDILKMLINDSKKEDHE